ncbi:Ig-like domain-containing protein, partial [Cyanobium sp. Morenito 9A2]|uniref:Ig-like domain-containing protein n=1 Tax=Cyanobium sp. Morenito 9A2 TaxID=2823718 RepID=UPI0021BC49C0
LVSGETLRLFNGSTLLGSATVNNSALTWSYTPTLPATAGTNYSITARVADAAGNLGTASAARTFVLDTTAPTTKALITAVTDNIGLIQGVVAPSGRTDDLTPTITGTLSAALVSGETLRLFNGSTLLGSATVNNSALTWSYTPTLPATAGTNYFITARVADAAGNLGTASAARTFVLDTTAPTTKALITAVTDNIGLIQGVVAPSGRTDDLTPTITGTLSAALVSGETLRLFNGSTLLGSATVNNSALTWSYTPTLPATAGTNYSITARVADAAGNLGTASAARTFVLDTAAPTITTGPIATDASGFQIIADSASTATLEPIGGGSLFTTNLASNSSKIISVTAQGSVNFTSLVVTDLAGNRATSSTQIILGTSGNDTIQGFSSDQLIYGFSGNDILNGGSGSDTLIGGSGNDTLTGGSGPDRFRFSSPLNATTNRDPITDFSIADGDSIELENAVFTAFSTPGTLAANAFAIGASAATSAQHLLYDSATGLLSYDADGNSAGASIAFAQLTPGLALTSGQFAIT